MFPFKLSRASNPIPLLFLPSTKFIISYAFFDNLFLLLYEKATRELGNKGKKRQVTRDRNGVPCNRLFLSGVPFASYKKYLVTFIV